MFSLPKTTLSGVRVNQEVVGTCRPSGTSVAGAASTEVALARFGFTGAVGGSGASTDGGGGGGVAGGAPVAGCSVEPGGGAVSSFGCASAGPASRRSSATVLRRVLRGPDVSVSIMFRGLRSPSANKAGLSRLWVVVEPGNGSRYEQIRAAGRMLLTHRPDH